LDQGGYFKGDLLVADEQQMENAAHPVRVLPTRIRMGEVFKVIQADGTFEFPVAFGLVVPNMPDHLYTDLDTSYKNFRIPGRRLPQKVNGEMVRGAGDCSEPVETMERVAIPEEVSDALPSSSSSRSSIAEQSSDYWSMPNLTAGTYSCYTEVCTFCSYYRKLPYTLGVGGYFSQNRDFIGSWTVTGD